MKEIHVGPYFRCVSKLVEKTVSQNDACPDLRCKNYGKKIVNYCSECGTPKANVGIRKLVPSVAKRDVRDSIGEDTLFNLFGEYPWNKQQEEGYETHIWVANGWPQGSERASNHVCDDENFSFENITPELVLMDKENLLKAFRTVYDRLAEMYGNDNVFLEWGVVKYYY